MSISQQPEYVRPSRTSFSTKKKLSVLVREIDKAFKSASIVASFDEFSWDCSALRLGALVSFTVRVFLLPDRSKGHLVEMRHLSGCRHSFSVVSGELAAHLQVSFDSAKRSRCPDGPSSSYAAHALPPPSLRRSEEASVVRMAGAASTSHLLELMTPGSSLESISAGCRAVGALCAEAVERQSSTEQSSCLAVPTWLPIVASRVVEIASTPMGTGSEIDVDEIRAVALAAVACAAPLDMPQSPGNGNSDWLGAATDAAIVGVIGCGESEDYQGTFPPHVLRESLRLSAALARDSTRRDVRQRFKEADGFLDITSRMAESQAAGVATQQFARGTILAC